METTAADCWATSVVLRLACIGSATCLQQTTYLWTFYLVVDVTSTFCTETSETVPNMCVVVEREMLYQVTL